MPITSETQPGAVCSGAGSPTSGCISYLYDADNELTSRSYADGATHNVTAITYDADGRRTGQTDDTGTSSTKFDSLGRLTSSTDGNNVTLAYGYDLAGNETTVTYNERPGPSLRKGSVTRSSTIPLASLLSIQ